ncbi:hypothetical protein AW736_19085 [Termitidicoccus mucosus]|uniref:DUF6250 domain-containing protein n=2 Tax=Termitidicoccus mucosus TaxID=1184151 RepID=A0A178IEK3_9BACT|nr:hypothetical protein AW736_19085 [Opitutaceae bacterium TSB47]
MVRMNSRLSTPALALCALFGAALAFVPAACKPAPHAHDRSIHEGHDHARTHAVRQPGDPARPVIASDDFYHGLGQWVVEQMSGGTVSAADGILTIADEAGCTVWFRQKFAAPLIISYDATMNPEARVSDLNCFWMASDPANPADLFHPAHQRTGQFSTYDTLNTYYVGYGGNANTTTRFRRYDGTGARPLLPEHDLSDAAHLLKPAHTYAITITVTADGATTFARDGEVIFSYRDPKPLAEGWFGFRTVKSRIEIKNFRVFSL